MDDRYEPDDIVVKRDEAITITFHDGHVGHFPIMEVRLGCPCATCRNLRDNSEPVWPRPDSPQPLRIVDADLHGAWGLHLTWNDGHATGIFPFDALRRWSDGQPPDSLGSTIKGDLHP